MTTKTFDVHLVVVTGQAQANLIPILQLEPDVVALAISDDMRKNADDFKELLKRLKPELNIQCFDNVPSVGLFSIEQKATEIYQVLQSHYAQSTITYHATGGTKLMVLGFYNVFAKANNIVIYNDTEHGQIEIVYPSNTPAIPVKHLLDTQTYLRSLSFDLRNSSDANSNWTEPARKRQALTQWLADNASLLNQFFGDINTLVDAAMDKYKKRVINPQQVLKTAPSDIMQTALEQLNAFHICQWQAENPEHITFNSVNNAKYLSGAWLEEYVWLVADSLGMNEVKANVRFSPLGNTTIDNEMDGIIVHNNRLLAIECKTASLERDTKNTTNMLYKLEALSKIGGLYHEEWLVSARPVPAETQTRADSSKPKIKIISPEQLKTLKTELENWRNAKR